jgi:uncharacterized membrane protein YhaH (DUF805 family)
MELGGTAMSDINWSHLFFGFSGRINRAKWWLTVLVTTVINILVSIISNAVQSTAVVGVLALVAFIAVCWIYLAAGVKRLHDLNRTGAWLVLFLGTPIVALILIVASVGLTAGAALLAGQTPDPAAMEQMGMVATIAGLACLVVGIWALVWFGCLRGTVGPNQYGPDPLEGKV